VLGLVFEPALLRHPASLWQSLQQHGQGLVQPLARSTQRERGWQLTTDGGSEGMRLTLLNCEQAHVSLGATAFASRLAAIACRYRQGVCTSSIGDIGRD